MKRFTNQKGFTIVELVVTIAVLGVMIVAVAGVFESVQSIQRKTTRYEQATRLATQKLESLRNNNYNNLVPGSTIDFSNEIPTDQLPNANASINITEPNPGLIRADVSISYSDNSSPRTVKLSSLIGIIGITQ